jgi:hypothetical protein
MNTRFSSITLLIGLVLTMIGATLTSRAAVSMSAVMQDASIGSGFTYQGELKNVNGPVNATCAFQFALYDAASCGAQVGATLSQSVRVADGLFTIQLDFGAGSFNGKTHWLQIAVRCPGDTGFTLLTPRQQLTAVPYALSLMPGATISGSTDVGLTIENTATSASGLALNGGAVAAIEALVAGNGTGVASRSPSGVAVQGESTSGTGVEGESTSGTGVLGRSPTAVGVQGESTDGVGVQGESTNSVAVRGRSPVVAVQGESTDGVGVLGRSSGGRAGQFEGDVHITRNLTRAYTEGTANLAVPIAYAALNSDGSLSAGTPNVSSTWDSLLKLYRITIAGENYSAGNYITVVTPITEPALADPLRLVRTYSQDGDLLILLSNSSGNLVQGPVQFVIYKP